MTTSVFPASPAKVQETKQYLAELRDARLKKAGCTSEDRLSFLEDRIRLIRGK